MPQLNVGNKYNIYCLQRAGVAFSDVTCSFQIVNMKEEIAVLEQEIKEVEELIKK